MFLAKAKLTAVTMRQTGQDKQSQLQSQVLVTVQFSYFCLVSLDNHFRFFNK